MSAKCSHLDEIRKVPASSGACAECLRAGTNWVHLRQCLTCGHVGCCDSSPGKHAAAHFQATTHSLMRSAEPGEDWGWCYIDEAELPAAVLVPR